MEWRPLEGLTIDRFAPILKAIILMNLNENNVQIDSRICGLFQHHIYYFPYVKDYSKFPGEIDSPIDMNAVNSTEEVEKIRKL
ncbi:hypothetical protein HHI36_002031, partial [Cryptolaemus montrouzieri]